MPNCSAPSSPPTSDSILCTRRTRKIHPDLHWQSGRNLYAVPPPANLKHLLINRHAGVGNLLCQIQSAYLSQSG